VCFLLPRRTAFDYPRCVPSHTRCLIDRAKSQVKLGKARLLLNNSTNSKLKGDLCVSTYVISCSSGLSSDLPVVFGSGSDRTSRRATLHHTLHTVPKQTRLANFIFAFILVKIPW
jgi:hypothetical protein